MIPAPEAALRVENLTVGYSAAKGTVKQVVHGIDLELHPGRILGLVGESGSGKSTAALAAVGYVRRGTRVLTGRSVLGDGTDILALPEPARRRLWGPRIAFVPQSASMSLNPGTTIGKQLAQPLVRHLGLTGAALRARQIDLLEQMGLPAPEKALKRYPFQFSGGQQQRISLAISLSCNPEVLVLDEPTTGLDVTTQARTTALLRRLVDERSLSALYISHDLALLGQVADDVAVLNAGEIVERSTMTAFAGGPVHPYARALFDLVAATERGPSRAASAQAPADADRISAAPVLSVDALAFAYKGAAKPALRDVSLEVLPGERIGIVGESGSGKSTLLRVIAGLAAPTSGSVRFEGEALAPRIADRPTASRRAVQLIFQNPDASLNPRQTIETILTRPIRLFRDDIPRSGEEAFIAELLEAVRLPASFAHRYPRELSGGQRQRIAIARAFAAKPRVLLCDEITSALDVSVQATVLELLADLSKRTGVGIVFVGHDLSVVRSTTERAFVMRDGAVVDSGPTESLFTAPTHEYTRQLVEAAPSLTGAR